MKGIIWSRSEMISHSAWAHSQRLQLMWAVKAERVRRPALVSSRWQDTKKIWKKKKWHLGDEVTSQLQMICVISVTPTTGTDCPKGSPCSNVRRLLFAHGKRCKESCGHPAKDIQSVQEWKLSRDSKCTYPYSSKMILSWTWELTRWYHFQTSFHQSFNILMAFAEVLPEMADNNTY